MRTAVELAVPILVKKKGLCEQSTGTEIYKEINLNLVNSWTFLYWVLVVFLTSLSY